MAPANTSTDNGQSTVDGAPTKTLPPNVAVTVNGVTIIAPHGIAKKPPYNPFYRAVTRKQLKPGRTIEDALLNAAVEFNGTLMTTGERNTNDDGSRKLVLSSPRTHKKGPKAGQIVPNTGGNPTISFTRTLREMGGDNGFLLRVTLTGVTKAGIATVTLSVGCNKINVGSYQEVGEVLGELDF